MRRISILGMVMASCLLAPGTRWQLVLRSGIARNRMALLNMVDPAAPGAAQMTVRQSIRGPDILLNGKRLYLRRASLLPYMYRVLDPQWFRDYVADLRAKVYPGNRVALRGEIEVSWPKESLRDKTGASRAPTIAAFQQSFSVVLDNGSPLELAAVASPDGGALAVRLQADILD